MADKIDPSRFRRRNYQAEPVVARTSVTQRTQPVRPVRPVELPVQAESLSTQPQKAAVQHQPNRQPAAKPKNIKKRLALLFLVLLLILGLVGAGFWYFEHKISSTAPKPIAQSVNFPLYYPDLGKLPKGYSYNSFSFETPVKDGVLLTIKYSTDKKVVISMQAAPTEMAMRAFLAKYLASPVAQPASSGTALVGTYNGKTLVSLQTKDATWLVVTAPGDINRDELNQVLQAIKKQEPKDFSLTNPFSS